MQVWNQVKVKAAGKFEGAAGVVLRVDGEVATVKLDLFEQPENFAVAELEMLG